jgi:hypothetical protein
VLPGGPVGGPFCVGLKDPAGVQYDTRTAFRYPINNDNPLYAQGARNAYNVFYSLNNKCTCIFAITEFDTTTSADAYAKASGMTLDGKVTFTKLEGETLTGLNNAYPNLSDYFKIIEQNGFVKIN